jgi:hypothetical protein
MGRDNVQPYEREMDERDGVMVGHVSFGRRGHIIERERCFVAKIRTRDPSKVLIGDHHVRMSASTLLRAAVLGHVFTPPNSENLLARFEVTSHDLVAGAQELFEGRHAAESLAREAHPALPGSAAVSSSPR